MTAAAIAARLAARAEPDGFVPFDRFMDAALYADGVGRYARPDPPLGTGGDFYTAAHVSPLFGATIADRCAAVGALLPRREPPRIVEVGAGDGALAEAILRAVPLDTPFAEYVIVDRSGPLRARAVARAEAVRAPVRVRTAPALSADGPFCGVVIANELLDALPARRVRWDGTGWRELGVRWTGDRFAPAESAARDPVPVPAQPVPAGSVLEFAPAALGFVREIGDHLAAGAALLLDYGMGTDELVRGHPTGTLAGARRHRPVDDPLDAPGETDLSVFVDFDRLRAAARSAGLRELGFSSQAEALARWGFEARLAAAVGAAPDAAARVKVQLAAKNLLFGFDRFRVLELAPPATGRARGATDGRPGPSGPAPPRASR
ncbi:MAG TPA: SAM-dependent methyltransferase [Thermoplasmata archaeon]|nr:SAM-dependent methyltransferase [Thermoplasmata archaeon]